MAGVYLNFEVLIRQATKNDILKLKDTAALSFPWFSRFFASYSLNSEDGKVLVAEIQEGIVGFAKLIEFKVGSSKYGCILWIAVHPKHHRKGIALALVKASIENFKHDGVETVVASVGRTNEASLTTFNKAGFVRIGFWGLWQLLGFRIFSFYRDIWYAPIEVVLMNDS